VLNRYQVCRFCSLQAIKIMQILKRLKRPLMMIAMYILFKCSTCVTWCSTSHDSLAGCIPGDWRCQCPQCEYGNVLMIYMYIYMGLQGNSMHINSDSYVTTVHVRIKGLSCSSKQTDIAPKFSMFCALNTSFHIIMYFACENPSQGYRHQL
jgi:hypothetical protein